MGRGLGKESGEGLNMWNGVGIGEGASLSAPQEHLPTILSGQPSVDNSQAGVAGSQG